MLKPIEGLITIYRAYMNTSVSKLTTLITQAHREELLHGNMEDLIQNNIADLHNAITISSSTPSATLIRFVSDYIDSVPQHLLALQVLSEEAHIDDYVLPFINLAYTFFFNPPELLEPYDGLRNMLHKAYLAHRLMEEVNDQVMSLGGAALAPMDMSMANIICHTLIGDEIANSLDHLVLLSLETTCVDSSIFNEEQVRDFMKARKFNGWNQVLKKWPCFTKNFGLDLQIGS